MIDEDLACELIPDNPCAGLIAVSRLTVEKRRVYVRLIEVGRELNLWSAGVGPKPTGIIICKPHRNRP